MMMILTAIVALCVGYISGWITCALAVAARDDDE